MPLGEADRSDQPRFGPGLGWGLGLGLFACGLGPAVAAAQGLPPSSGACAPAVQVEGDPALSSAVSAALRARGVASQPSAGCPVTRVSLQGSELHIVVLLRDEIRRAERVVADRDTAVALIESWVRSDLSAPLLLSAVLPSPAAPAPEPPPALSSPAPAVSARPAASAAAYFDVGGDVTGRPWLGANLRGCGRLYRLCLGGSWRTLAQIGNESRDGRRIATEFLALVALPLTWGRLSLTPSLGLGVSWLHTAARILVEESHGSIEESGSSASGTVTAVAVSADQGQLQAELRLELAVRLVADLSLSLAAGFDATLSHVTPPLVAVPVTKDGTTTSQIVELAMPPWGLGLGQLGLRWSPR